MALRGLAIHEDPTKEEVGGTREEKREEGEEAGAGGKGGGAGVRRGADATKRFVASSGAGCTASFVQIRAL